MNQKQKYLLETLRATQDFLDTNAASVGTVNTQGGRTELDTVVAQLSAQGANQDASQYQSIGETGKKGSLRTTLRMTYMRPIAEIAKARLSAVPEISALKLPAPQIDTQGLINAAQAMALAAQPYTSTFTGLGLATDFVTQLQTAASALAASVDNRKAFRIAGVGATAGAESEASRARHALKVLDAQVAPLLATDPTLLASWKSVIRVVAKPGVADATKKSKPAPTPTPAATPAVHPSTASETQEHA